MGITLTAEQRHARDLFCAGEDLVIEAGAGTGKTSTLKALADSTTRRGQYVVFNKSMATEAKRKFPAHVDCRTAHSLAFRAVGHRYKRRLDAGRMTSGQIAAELGITSPIRVPGINGEARDLSYAFLAGYVMDAVRNFCQSADPELTERHFRVLDIDAPNQWTNNNALRHAMAPYARKVWADAQLVTGGRLPFTHDYYLKMFELSEPVIPAAFILFDEAQDASPVLLSIVNQQAKAQRVFVGDSAQAIYGFTGAVDALSQARATGAATARLSQSFRFGPAVAAEANRVLAVMDDTDMVIRGLDSIPSTVGDIDNPTMVLSRTNAAAVAGYIQARQRRENPHLVGGGTEMISFCKGALDLQEGRRSSHRDLACFMDWAEVKEYVKADALGEDLKLNVGLVEMFGAAGIIDALSWMPTAERADVVYSTAHKAKGLESDRVKIGADYRPVDRMAVEELRLLYVAFTRARRALDIGNIMWTSPRES